MAKKPDWDYALRIRGVSLKTLPVALLADYLKEFAALLGDDAVPVLDGIVKGSVIVRVRQAGEHAAYTRNRIQRAANDPLVPGGRSFAKITELMKRSGARGEIVDRQENTVVAFPISNAPEPIARQVTINDVGTLDGQVVGINGADDTVHLRLQDKGGVEYRIVIRDIAMAQDLAKRFRSDIVRVHVHGTWVRNANKKWAPKDVYADRIEVLDKATIKEVVADLRAVRTGWSEVNDPLKELADIREDG